MPRTKKIVKVVDDAFTGVRNCVTCTLWRPNSEYLADGRCGKYALHTPPMHTCKEWLGKEQPIEKNKKKDKKKSIN